MSIAIISLITLIVVLVISTISSYNVGLLAIAFAFIVSLIGDIPVKTLFGGFPTSMFIMLVGITYLFGIAQVNGTIEIISKVCMKFVSGKKGLIPVVLFVLAAVVSAAGAGAIATTAMLAPPSMALASRQKINPLLVGVLVAYGAISTGLIPFSATGVILNGILDKVGLSSAAWTIFRNSLIESTLVAAIAYVVFGGLKLWKKEDLGEAANIDMNELIDTKFVMKRENILTFIALGLLVVLAIVKADSVGLSALMLGVVLICLKCADEQKVIKSMPWNVIMMVSGVSLLVSLMSATGGMKMFEDIVANVSSPKTVLFITTFFPALFSAYASTLVTYTAFIPIMPGVAQAVGGVDPVAIISGLATGAVIVDVSPLSTIGALILGAATAEMDKNKLFRGMLYWGFAMTVVGSLASWVLYGLIGL